MLPLFSRAQHHYQVLAPELEPPPASEFMPGWSDVLNCRVHTPQDWLVHYRSALLMVMDAPLPGKVLGLEQSFRLELGGVPYIGYLDFVLEHDGVLTVVDLKTGQRRPTPEDLKNDLQFALYYAATDAKQLWYWYFWNNELLPVPRNDDYIAKITTNGQDMWAMMQANSYPAQRGGHCRWCAVKNHCQKLYSAAWQ
jgi:hypothetical protein